MVQWFPCWRTGQTETRSVFAAVGLPRAVRCRTFGSQLKRRAERRRLFTTSTRGGSKNSWGCTRRLRMQCVLPVLSPSFGQHSRARMNLRPPPSAHSTVTVWTPLCFLGASFPTPEPTSTFWCVVTLTGMLCRCTAAIVPPRQSAPWGHPVPLRSLLSGPLSSLGGLAAVFILGPVHGRQQQVG